MRLIHDKIQNWIEEFHPAIGVGKLAIIISSVMAMVKLLAYVMTGSIAILASFVDSLLDIIISAMNYGAIRYSLKPADEDHRSGHGKIEGLAALIQAAVIFGAAFFLFFETIQRLFVPVELSDHWVGVIVMIFSIAMTFILVIFQKRAVEETGSLAVEADKTHYVGDNVVNIAVIVILVLDWFEIAAWLDTTLAFAITIWLGWMARNIAGKGMDMLMDRELPDQERSAILKTINKHQGVLGVHDLRTCRSGMGVSITFDIEVDPELSLINAHKIAKDVEADLLLDYPQAEIFIHIDPAGDIDDSRHQVEGIHH